MIELNTFSRLKSKLWRFLDKNILEIREIEEIKPRPDLLKHKSTSRVNAHFDPCGTAPIGVGVEKNVSTQEQWNESEPSARKGSRIRKKKEG